MIYFYQSTPNDGGDPYNGVRAIVNGVIDKTFNENVREFVNMAIRLGARQDMMR
ncbi:MAG: hypothetical protein LBI57_05640 [Helicobacteraceae bacterium]|nr:hypothetical protein [Helicobacteraceae bacterium]